MTDNNMEELFNMFKENAKPINPGAYLSFNGEKYVYWDGEWMLEIVANEKRKKDD